LALRSSWEPDDPSAAKGCFLKFSEEATYLSTALLPNIKELATRRIRARARR
jgi:hypothetical protein